MAVPLLQVRGLHAGLEPARLQGVGHQHGNGHWSDAARHGGDGAGFFGHRVKRDVAGVPIDLVCQLTQKESYLTGVCRGGGRPDRKVTGHVDDKNVQFSYDVDYQGTPVHLTYNGREAVRSA